MSEDDAPSEVALWYMRYHQPGYMLCDDEEDAAGLGVAMMDYGGASVLGVQFPDGRLIERENWAAYDAAERRRDEAERSARTERRELPVRKIRDPFRKWELEVEAGEPAWLGLPAR